jgi:hypothetical protein
MAPSDARRRLFYSGSESRQQSFDEKQINQYRERVGDREEQHLGPCIPKAQIAKYASGPASAAGSTVRRHDTRLPSHTSKRSAIR